MDVISLLRQQAEAAHAASARLIEGLTPEQLYWHPPGSANPIGATFAHVVLNEDWLVHAALTGGAPLYENAWAEKTGFSSVQPSGGAWAEWGRTVQIDLPALRRYAEVIYAATDAYLATLKPDDLDRESEFPPGSSRTRTLSRVLSGPLIGHHLNHCGEIAALKGAQGLQGYGF